MKAAYKNLVSVLGALALSIPFTGCETDAQEVAQGQTNAPAKAGAAAAADQAGSTNAPAAAAPAAEPGDTNALSTVILNKIPPTVPANVKLSKGVEEIIKLAQSGVSETVVLLFIEKTEQEFDIDAAEIVYLNDIGISSTVIAAMLAHDGEGEDILHDALGTNDVQVATTPPAQAPAGVAAQAAPGQLEISSNYVATVPQYPVAQEAQPVVVEQQPIVVQQPAVVVTQPAVTYSYFYSSLSPYGSWLEVPDYGWCWQPTIAVTHHGWRPYLHGGRWLNSDAGWYWHSNYSWGWAPFHYGRWYCAPRAGWVWVPDYTWGPSWVTWRRSGAYCGWAPLPPRAHVRPGVGFSYWGRDFGFSFGFGYSHDYYTFVPTRRFCDRRIVDHVVPTHNTGNIYKDSTVVNNYIVGDNNTIINNGIGRDYVASHVRSEIPRVRVEEAPVANGRLIPPDRIQQRGAEAVVYRPSRPSPTLVAAHEAAVARTRGEVARPSGLSAASSGSRIPSSVERAAPARPTGSPVRGAVPSARGEVSRPRIASAVSETPVFGTPAPVRPEPDRSAEILRSRASQESLSRSAVPSVRRGSVLRSESVRPGAVSPINRAPLTAGTPQRVVPPATVTTPSGRTVPSIRSRNESIARPEVGRLPAPARSPDLVQPRSSQPAPSRTPVQRPSITPSPGNARPSVKPSPGSSRPSVTPSTSRPTVSSSQSFYRPAPVTSQPARTFSRSGPINVTPNWSTAPQSSISSTPGTIRRAPVTQAPAAAAAPSVVQRSENFGSRPSVPVRAAPSPMVVQPRTYTPVTRAPAVQSRGSLPTRSYSAPVAGAPVRSAPQVSTSPGSIRGGGSFRAPAAAPAPAARPSPVQSSGGRGRVEIGR